MNGTNTQSDLHPMNYSRIFKKGKNKMRISKKYFLNDDDIVRVGQKLYKVGDMVGTLPYTVDAYYSEDNNAEIFLHGNNKKAIPLEIDDIVAPIDVPSFECMRIGDQLMATIDINFFSSCINQEHQAIYFERNVSNEN